MDDPVSYDVPYCRSTDPNFREYLNPLESRRMGKILKRALVTSIQALHDAGVIEPEAIITGTGLGCIENTELFLDQLCREGEQLLKPTHFMQSTHNTIGSLIGIHTKSHGYNITYSHKSVSFDSALLDAYIQTSLGDINNALVCGNDEMTPSYFSILQRTGYVGLSGEAVCGEAAVAMMVDAEQENAMCELAGILMMYNPSDESFTQTVNGMLSDAGIDRPDALMIGINGAHENDAVYHHWMSLLPLCPVLHYKHIFGECYTASGLGVYASACCLKKGMAPLMMRCDGGKEDLKTDSILFINHSDGHNISLILLKK
jgi:3-oxoacyl-(acyl-carrier-protein) synthase